VERNKPEKKEWSQNGRWSAHKNKVLKLGRQKKYQKKYLVLRLTIKNPRRRRVTERS